MRRDYEKKLVVFFVKYRTWRGLGLCWECMVAGRWFILPDNLRDTVDGNVPEEEGGREGGVRLIQIRRECFVILKTCPHSSQHIHT